MRFWELAKRNLKVAVRDPLSLGVLQSPADAGAGIAVGEGQALGNAMSFGGGECKSLPSAGQVPTKGGRRGPIGSCPVPAAWP